MELIEFIGLFKRKPTVHKLMWFEIILRIDVSNRIDMFKLIDFLKISKASLYRIFKLYNNEITINKNLIKFSIKDSYVIIEKIPIKKNAVTLVKTKPKKELAFTNEVIKCYTDCIVYFPEHLHPKESLVKSWLSTIDKLNRLDKIPFELIVKIVAKTRDDDFWSKNFLSLTKLRKKNQDGILYIIVFNEKFNKTANKIEKANDTINKAKEFDWESNKERSI